MVKKSSGWNLQDMQDTLVKDTEQKISDGFEEIKQEQSSASSGSPAGNAATVPDGSLTKEQSVASQSLSGSQQEPTKGVQTYIRMTDYQRLFTQKMLRDMETSKNGGKAKTTLAILAAEAISLWLDVQESKRQVT